MSRNPDELDNTAPDPNSTTSPGTAEIDTSVANMHDRTALPRKNGELVFEAPWQARAFGLAVVLCKTQGYSWDDFRRLLIAEISSAGVSSDNPATDYYTCWTKALQRLLIEKKMASVEELEEKTREVIAARSSEHIKSHERKSP